MNKWLSRLHGPLLTLLLPIVSIASPTSAQELQAVSTLPKPADGKTAPTGENVSTQNEWDLTSPGPDKIVLGWVTALGVLILIFAVGLSSASNSAVRATSTDMPFHFVRSSDCNAEQVEIRGTLRILNKSQVNGTVISNFDYQNVRGIGLSSGNTYRSSTVSHVRLKTPFPSSMTSAQNFQLISHDAEGSLLVQVLYRIDVDANGEVSAAIDDLRMQCR